MQVMFPRCAGLDVHRDSVYVCVALTDEKGHVTREIRDFGATTEALLEMRAWLEQHEVTHAVIESTGVYWKPVFNILDGGVELWVANAHEVKALPGRKTDVRDCEWLADLMRHGLVKRSFVPDRAQHELRELTRYRTQVTRERASEVNRVHKLLEGANIKLGAVLTDVVGVSGRKILRAMCNGVEDPKTLASLAVERVQRTKRKELEAALRGSIRHHQRFMLGTLLDRIDDIERTITKLDAEVEERLRPFAEEIRRLREIPGFGRTVAEVFVAEMGTDMSRFPSDAHAASWAGLCPGNNKSAGKRQSGKTRKGSQWLRSGMVQAAWASSRKKDSYLRARFQRLKARRGPKKALVAQAHLLLRMAYFILRDGASYADLGADYFDRVAEDRTLRHLTKRLERMG